MKNIFKMSLPLIVVSLLIFSCNKNPVEKAMDDFETFVTKWEKKSNYGIISRKDLVEYYADRKKLDQDNNRKIIENYPGWTEDLVIKLETLRKRANMLRVDGEARLSD